MAQSSSQTRGVAARVSFMAIAEITKHRGPTISAKPHAEILFQTPAM
jgi:hypothetical protein